MASIGYRLMLQGPSAKHPNGRPRMPRLDVFDHLPVESPVVVLGDVPDVRGRQHVVQGTERVVGFYSGSMSKTSSAAPEILRCCSVSISAA